MNLLSVRHPPPPFFVVVVVLIIGNIDITFKSNLVLKITDARRLSHKLDCPALSVLFYWRHVERIFDKLGKKKERKINQPTV